MLQNIFSQVSLTETQKAQQSVYKLEADFIYSKSEAEKSKVKSEILNIKKQFNIKTFIQ